MSQQRAWRWRKPPEEEEEEGERCFLDMMARKPSPAECQHKLASCSISRRSGPTMIGPIRQSVFLSLPGEIRNRIYEEVALSTRLIHRPRAHPLTRSLPGPGLTLACKQTNYEFMPMLCAKARWSIYVRGFDFRDVIKVEWRLSKILQIMPNCAPAMLQSNLGLEIVLINASNWDEGIWRSRICQWLQHHCSINKPLNWIYRVEQSLEEQRQHRDQFWYKWKVGVTEIQEMERKETREDAVEVLNRLVCAFEDEAKRVEQALKIRDIECPLQLGIAT